MALQKSPGQKRLRNVRIITFLLFIAVTYPAAMLLGHFKTNSLAWVKGHQESSATVIKKWQEVEEYRNLKGRKRQRDVYFITYRFEVEGNEYTETIKVADILYEGLEKDRTTKVWYQQGNPGKNDLAANVALDLGSNTMMFNIIGVLIYTIPATLFLYYLLKLVFVRESKKVLPEGFYTEHSWLDIDDKYVVALDNNNLVYFKIHPKRSSQVQEAYQKDASLDQLFKLSKANKIGRIPLNEISHLSSNHNSDYLTVEHNDKNHHIEFLNQTVKGHALERVRKLIPDSLAYTRKERSRLRAAIPSMIFLAILSGLLMYFENPVINIVIVFIAIVWVIPRVFSRLIDPTITESWDKAEA